MNCNYLFAGMMALVFISCKKQKEDLCAEPPALTAFHLPLKEIVIPHLPSPMYHFEYDTGSKINFISYASGLNRYYTTFTAGRLTEIRNDIPVNRDRLQYFYDAAGRVNMVNYADSNGIVYTKIFFTYKGKQLTHFERQKKLANSFVIDKTIAFSYHADGNLLEASEHRPAYNGQDELHFVDRYEQYDKGINADGFALLHKDFFDHLVLLPGIRLQQNNPGKLTRTGNSTNYQIDYTYTYNDRNFPLIKSGKGVWLSGPAAGKSFSATTLFSYY